MSYYKIMNGLQVIGAGTSLDLRCFQEKYQLLLICDESEAQYIEYNDTLYHTDWMLKASNKLSYTEATVTTIDQQEYGALKEALDSGEEIPPEEQTVPEEPEEDVPGDPVEEATVEFVRKRKIAQMRKICGQIIVGGVEVELSGGIVKHFDLEIEDQLNLITLSGMISQGYESVPYHATDELCEYYSAEDMQKVINAATEQKTYHTSYYNSLENWIESMEDIATISAVQYGDTIPEAYCSEVMKQLAQGSNNE